MMMWGIIISLSLRARLQRQSREDWKASASSQMNWLFFWSNHEILSRLLVLGRALWILWKNLVSIHKESQNAFGFFSIFLIFISPASAKSSSGFLSGYFGTKNHQRFCCSLQTWKDCCRFLMQFFFSFLSSS